MALPWRNTQQQLQKRRRRKCAIFYFSEVTIEGGVKGNNATLKCCGMHLLLLLWWVQQVRWSWRKKKLLPDSDCSDCLKKSVPSRCPRASNEKEKNWNKNILTSSFLSFPLRLKQCHKFLNTPEIGILKIPHLTVFPEPLRELSP